MDELMKEFDEWMHLEGELQKNSRIIAWMMHICFSKTLQKILKI